MKGIFLLLIFGLLFYLEGQERELRIKVGIADPAVYGNSTDLEGNLELLALRRILEIQGIPFAVLEKDQNLSAYKCIITAGSLSNPRISQEFMNRLLDYVELGGIVFSAGEIGSKLYSLYGVEQHHPSRRRYRLSFQGTDPVLLYLDRPEERTISLGNGEDLFYDDVIWSHGYTAQSTAVILGRFEDSRTGFLANPYGRGKAYLLGMSFSESVLLPQRNGDYEAQRQFVNSFEPSADVIMLILKALYQEVYSTSLVLSVIPQGRPNALILSHDVDAQTSFVDSLKFARLEEQYHCRGTYFINTKTFTNAYDIGYYNLEENVEALRELHRRGADIASHSVSHDLHFSQSLLGDPDVDFSSYRPSSEVTVYGEVKVSKEILDRDIPGLNTLSFRAGHLEFPYSLIKVLEESGYRYDSSFSANDTLTAFPFFALETQDLGAEESSIVEIPVTMDDALEFLRPDTVDRVIAQWIDLCDANGNNGGINVLLVHPSDTRDEDFKLRAQEGLMKHMAEQEGWMGNITEFGDYWVERHQLSYRLLGDSEGRLIIELNKPQDQVHPWISFELTGSPSGEILLRDSKGALLESRIEWREDKFMISLSPSL